MLDVASIASGLRLGTDGIWYGVEQQDLSYPAGGNEACFAIEDHSYWFKHRNRCICSLVERFPPQNRDAIFDIGGGNGYVSLGLLEAGFEVAVIEPGPLGASNAKRRGIETVICATPATARIRRGALGAVGLFDVIEHVDEDVAFLKSVRQLVKSGGLLYATVPAYRLLWSDEDDLAGHFRRYSSSAICRSIASAGFEVQFVTYIFRPLPIPIALFRVLPYRLRFGKASSSARDYSRDHGVQGGLSSRLLSWALDREVANIKANKTMRFGGSCILTARAI